MARNHDIDSEAADHFKGVARCRQRVLAAHDLAENDAEAVLPQGIAGDEDALVGTVVDQRFHIVARGRERLPTQPTHVEFAAGLDHCVVGKAVATLFGRIEQQGIGVPVADHALDTGGDHDAAAECRLQRGIAADMVGV